MKVWNYFFLAIGLDMLFTMAGLFNNAGVSVSNSVMTLIGFTISNGVINFDFSGSSFFSTIFSSGALLGLGAASVGTVVVGFLSRAKPENYLTLAILAPTFIIISSTLINIVKVMRAGSGDSPIGAIALLVVAPIAIMFAVSALEFFRGTD